MKIRNIIGERFGRLRIISRVPTPGRRVCWLCQCDCGKQKVVITENILSGRTKSCGCLRAEVTSARSKKHGHAGGRDSAKKKATKEYRAWSGAKDRCYNEMSSKFHCYGARGIKMCARWRADFLSFYADMGPAPPGMTLERKCVDSDYTPNNCVWASWLEQANNKQQSVFVEWNGERMTLKDVSRKTGVPYKALHAAFRYGNESLEKIVDRLSKRKSVKKSA